MALWNRRSPHNLLGNTIGATHGHWLSPGMSGTGAGIDSFFEYGMKAAIMMGKWGYAMGGTWGTVDDAHDCHVSSADTQATTLFWTSFTILTPLFRITFALPMASWCGQLHLLGLEL